MKLSGTHKFKASSVQVFNAILNPQVLQASIPGSNAVNYVNPTSLVVDITTSIPGLKGPYQVAINITDRREPNYVQLQVVRQGRGGSINATCNITIADEADGALLNYEGNADLEGPIAIVNNPLGQGIVKNSLGSFFKNLESHM